MKKKPEELKRILLSDMLNPETATFEEIIKVILFANRNPKMVDKLLHEAVIVRHLVANSYN
ncbi:MAG: hypothetical protein JWO09_876 [Bacteroidetes bacterium]|nr:hypothetical protein [Bacteroidota bacterium]